MKLLSFGALTPSYATSSENVSYDSNNIHPCTRILHWAKIIEIESIKHIENIFSSKFVVSLKAISSHQNLFINFNPRNRKKTHGVISGEYGGYSMTFT